MDHMSIDLDNENEKRKCVQMLRDRGERIRNDGHSPHPNNTPLGLSGGFDLEHFDIDFSFPKASPEVEVARSPSIVGILSLNFNPSRAVDQTLPINNIVSRRVLDNFAAHKEVTCSCSE
jgi:hypothetical protein